MTSDDSDAPRRGANLPEVTTDMPAVRADEVTPFDSRPGGATPGWPGAWPGARRPTPPAPPKPPPIALPGHAAEAALGGLAAASRAAADAERQKHENGIHDEESAPPPTERRAIPTELVDLLWHDDEAPARAQKRARRIAPPASWITEPAQSAAADPHRVVTRALTLVPVTPVADLQKSLIDAIDDEGLFVRPLLAVAGELEMRFDRKRYLEEMVAAARPFAESDRRLVEAVRQAERAAGPETRLLTSAIDAVGDQLEQAFAATIKSMPAPYLRQAAARALREEHGYASHLVLGGRHHLARLHAEAHPPVPTYLPERAAALLPLLDRFPVRLLVEPHLPQDPDEDHPLALRVLAIARTTPLPHLEAP